MSKKVRQLSKKVGQNKLSAKATVLEFFFDNPQRKITVRELAKQLKINKSKVQYYLQSLRQEGLVSSENRWVDTWFNRLIKSNYYTEKICRSGLIDYINEELGASAIILFGSFRKGESVKDSDIDIFVECARDKELNLSHYKQLLGHEIEIFVKPKITLLPKELLNNVVNGIKLRGFFTVK